MTETGEKRAHRTRSDGERSRRRILDVAARLVTVEGLDGLSIGRLAEESGMSKSGLYAHFGSKEELQLATLETANEIFLTEVTEPASRSPEGVERLEALCEAFLSHVERRVFPGGCFVASGAAEMGPRPGPIKRRLEELHRGWMAEMERQARIAVERGEIAASEDLRQLVFELDSYLGLGNTLFLLYGEPEQIERARRAVTERLAQAGSMAGDVTDGG